MTDKTKTIDAVETLIEKAAKAEDSREAMNFSQAACNAANAMCALRTAKRP